MPVSVDYLFLSKLEGRCRTGGYVPDVEKSKSGVTIATGFDLGARNLDDLRRIGLNGSLLSQLAPYLGLKKYEASRMLAEIPLSISLSECMQIDKAVKTHYITQLAKRYNDAISGDRIRFENLKSEFQTVITSVSYQYGLSLEKVTPKFRVSVVEQDWSGTVNILRDFQDNYPTRRNKEADLLEQAL